MLRHLIIFLIVAIAPSTNAQEDTPTAEDVAAEISGEQESVDVADEVQVNPVNSDQAIAARLQEVMQATGWYVDPKVDVDRGVAFLSGETDTQKHRDWAEKTAMNTADVVAVVNQLQLADTSLWNFSPALASVRQLGRDFASVLPLLLIAVAIGTLSYFAAVLGSRFTRWVLLHRIESGLLGQVFGNVIGVLIFIAGLYVALRVSVLTRLAVTLLGGTGLVGLALGFAFRDIAENYLASILISLNRPFRVGDLIEVDGSTGFVRKVTTRGTILNTFEGNQIQIPNSAVYKGKITNYTATPLSRLDFVVGIGFEDSVTDAQEILMDVLGEHSAVVDDPAPIAIVESLGASTVNLRAFFWFDQTMHSALKVSSSVIRQSKQRLTEAEITMPDEARELVFPNGVPVQMIEPSSNNSLSGNDCREDHRNVPERHQSDAKALAVEGDLGSEQAEVMRVTADDSTHEKEANLIE